MKKLKVIILITVVFIQFNTYSQIGINVDDPDTTSVLHIDADDRGILVPRISDTFNIKRPPAEGLLFYNDSTNVFNYYTGGMWQELIPFPRGGIIMWSGSNVPEGWALCDGSIVNGLQIPDLRGRFIVGYDPAKPDYNEPGNLSENANKNEFNILYQSEGNKGGDDSIQLIEEQLPSHNHIATTTSEGLHTHEASTSNNGGSHTHVTDDNEGAHEHRAYDDNIDGVGTHYHSLVDETGNTNVSDDRVGIGFASGNHIHHISSSGGHGHSITVNNVGSGHSHTIEVQPTGENQLIENRPKYYVLAFIIKL